MIRALAIVLVGSWSLAAHAQQPEAPLLALPYTPGLDVVSMDRSATA